MKRAIKWFIVITAVVIVVRFAGEFALTDWIARRKNYEAHSMHEGHVIVNEIKAHDSTINATWRTEGGQPCVVIRNVFEPDKQDMIVAWGKTVKQQGRVHRPITLYFQKEVPLSDIPDTVLRTVQF